MIRRTLATSTIVTLMTAGCVQSERITVDIDTRHQTIEGWGTCMISWKLAHTPYGNLAWRKAFRDLGLNILRVDMKKEALVDASGDMSIPVILGPDLEANIEKMDFNKPETAVFGEMAAWLKENALEPDRVKITGALWSPPHWMKGPTGQLKHHITNPTVRKPTPWLSEGKRGASVGGRLLQTPENLEQFGRYVAAWVKGFEQRYGVRFYAVSLQNELSFENPFDSATYERGPGGERGQWWQYAEALKAVKDVFTRQRIHTRLLGPHVAHVGKNPGAPWGLSHQMAYIAALKAHPDPELHDYLFAYNSNGYLGTNEDAVKMWAAYFRGKEAVRARWADSTIAPGVELDRKPIWVSEASGALGPWLAGEGGSAGKGAITVAQKMHNALVHANASAYVYWQMSDVEERESPYTLLGKRHVTHPHQSKKYSAFKQYSRYVRPGAVRVRAIFGNGRSSTGGKSEYHTYNGLNVSAYLHERDRTITVVLVNMQDSNKQVRIQLPGTLRVESFQAHLTSSDVSFARQEDLGVSEGKTSLTAPAYSVLTLHAEIAETRAELTR